MLTLVGYAVTLYADDVWRKVPPATGREDLQPDALSGRR